MKDKFPGFYRLNESALAELWHKATIALDANVLLNLYRYPAQAREDLLAVLGRLSSRLFIPYQAALEYQRNRLATIASQMKRFDEVRKVLGQTENQFKNALGELQLKKRHASINPDKLLEDLSALFESFEAHLGQLEGAEPNLVEKDSIRDTLDVIVGPNVGDPPEQKELDELYKGGASRYEQFCPPGYEDARKGRKDDAVYTANGLRIEKQFGDLIVWDQLLKASVKLQIKHLIFVTDDEKTDWWWKYESKGTKTFGPRPELIEEARRVGGVDLFAMYNSEQFLRYGIEYLGVTISKDSIEQIRDARHARRNLDWQDLGRAAEVAVLDWLNRIHLGRRILKMLTFPDYVVELEDSSKLGYEVKLVRVEMARRLRELLSRPVPDFKMLYLVFVATDDASIDRALALLSTAAFPANVSFVLGHLERDNDSLDEIFVPDLEGPRP